MSTYRDEAALLAEAPPGHRWWLLWRHGDPHRLAFTCGASLLAIAALWWATILWASAIGSPIRYGLPPTQTHALVMTFAFMPLFFAGFLASTGAKWLGRPPLAAAGLTFPLTLQPVGWLVVFVGASLPSWRHAGAAGCLGLAVVTLGWTLLWLRFVGLLRIGDGADRIHAGLIVLAGGVGALSMLAASIAVASGNQPLERGAIQLALWIFEGCTFAAAAHRMIPFLGNALPAFDSRRPRWVLEALAALFVLEGLTGACDALGGRLPAFAQWTRIALEATAGAALLAIAIRWGFVQSMRIRLLVMLRTGIAWLGLAFVLLGLSHALGTLTSGVMSLGAAPLHAYTMGFLGTTMLAMVARFICTHAGRTVVADGVLWRVFWLVQAAISARVAGGVMASFGLVGASLTIAVAALGWAVACTVWAARYVPWLAAPRANRPRRTD
jgi:uncharacterized protein involved in response to NO